MKTMTSSNNLLDPIEGVFWHPDRHEESCAHAMGQLALLRERLDSVHSPDIDAYIDATEEVFRRIIEGYDRPAGLLPDGNGPLEYAFMVPIRTSASGDPEMPGFGNPENPGPDYSPEISEFMPVAKFLNRFDAARLMRGLPPFVIDYLGGKEGDPAKGALVYTPIGFDAAYKIISNGGDYSREFGEIANATANFALAATHNLNVTVGLGAVLPRFTDFGRKIEGVNTTTGHAGTLSTIVSTLEKVEEDIFNGDLPNGHIGIMGNGAIGIEAALAIADKYKGKTISLYDINPERSNSLAKQLSGMGISVEVYQSPNDLFKATKVVVSAQTTPLDVASLEHENTRGVVIIDDSEPKSVDHDDAVRLEIRIVNVLCSGRDDILARRGFNYGGWIGEGKGEVFACNAEAALIGNLAAIGCLDEASELRVRGPADGESVRRIGDAFSRNGIVPARLQNATGVLYDQNGKLRQTA